MRISDWSSDVCSSDLPVRGHPPREVDDDVRRHAPDPPPLPVHVIIAAQPALPLRRLRGIIVGVEEMMDRRLEHSFDLYGVGNGRQVRRNHAETRGEMIAASRAI